MRNTKFHEITVRQLCFLTLTYYYCTRLSVIVLGLDTEAGYGRDEYVVIVPAKTRRVHGGTVVFVVVYKTAVIVVVFIVGKKGYYWGIRNLLWCTTPIVTETVGPKKRLCLPSPAKERRTKGASQVRDRQQRRK